jgi:hypothetical protein
LVSFKIKRTFNQEPKPFQLVRRVSDMAETNYEHMCYLTISEAEELNGEKVDFLCHYDLDDVRKERELIEVEKQQAALEKRKKELT